ncbi:MAG: EamA family transporter [bacterium]|nr:EamA family transporter [bacterium]
MNKPIIFSLLAAVFYAATNVVLEQKFAKFNVLTLMCVYLWPILICAVVGRWLTKSSDPSFDFPVGLNLAILVVLGLIWTAADYFYIGAFTNGGSLLTITSIMMMFPVFASLFKFLWVGGLPNMWQVSGYFLAAGAVFLVSKGGAP